MQLVDRVNQLTTAPIFQVVAMNGTTSGGDSAGVTLDHAGTCSLWSG